MLFYNDYNDYKKRFCDDLKDIEDFAESFSPLFTKSLCELAFSNVTIAFDENCKPEIKGNISNFDNLLDRLINKYGNSDDEEGKCFASKLESLKRSFNNEENYCVSGEGLLWIFDERWWDNDEIYRDTVRIKNAICTSYFGEKVQGCYIHNNKLIKLFVKNLDTNNYEDFLSVFVHELFHALHHFYLDDCGCNEILSEYFHVVVLESLATYFQVKYLEHRKLAIKAEKIKENVLRYSPIFYPYSGCKSLFENDDFFGDVILSSTENSFETALRKLVCKYDANIIMQKKNYKGEMNMEYSNQVNNEINSARNVLQSLFNGEWEENGDATGNNEIFINGKVIRLFIVGQGQSYEIESKRGHIYAPQNGYPNMRIVQPNDIIFSCSGGQIKSVNVALQSAQQTYGNEEGLRIDCLYSVLQNVINITPLRPILAGASPFNGNGHLPLRGYIHPLNVRAARILMEEIIRLGNTPR